MLLKIIGLGMVTIDNRSDTRGHKPEWQPGEKVWVSNLRQEATVVEQILIYDYADSYWGEVIVEYANSKLGAANSWQLSRIVE
jgi:hypothetical protein